MFLDSEKRKEYTSTYFFNSKILSNWNFKENIFEIIKSF